MTPVAGVSASRVLSLLPLREGPAARRLATRPGPIAMARTVPRRAYARTATFGATAAARSVAAIAGASAGLRPCASLPPLSRSIFAVGLARSLATSTAVRLPRQRVAPPPGPPPTYTPGTWYMAAAASGPGFPPPPELPRAAPDYGGHSRYMAEPAPEAQRQAAPGASETKDGRWNEYGRREPLRSWWRPLVFAFGFSYVIMFGAAYYTNKDAQYWWKEVQKKIGIFLKPSDVRMAQARKLDKARRAQETLKELPGVLSFLPTFLLVPILRSYIMLQEARLNMAPANAAQLMLISSFGVVFLGWRMRSLQPLWSRWMVHHSIAWTRRQDWHNTVTMFTSTFSHQDVLHLAVNSIALYSFGSAAYMFLAIPDQTIPYLPSATHVPHFLAFFAVAGLFSSLGSHLYNNLRRLPRLLRALRSPVQLSPTHALARHEGIAPSLGASGAVYACMTLTGLAFPDIEVSLIFLPMFAMPVTLGIGGMIAFDLYGLWRGSRFINHVAHLCGALFGVVYYYTGKQLWYYFRHVAGARMRQNRTDL